MSKRKKIIVLVSALVIVAAAAIAVDRLYKPKVELVSTPASNNDNSSQGQQAVVNDVPTEKLPAKLPNNLPLEKNAMIMQNYQAQTEDRMQSTRQYVSAKTLQENFDTFLDYLKKNKWTIVASSQDDQAIKSLAATKGEDLLNLVFNHNPVQDRNYVDISLTYPIVSSLQH